MNLVKFGFHKAMKMCSDELSRGSIAADLIVRGSECSREKGNRLEKLLRRVKSNSVLVKPV